MARLIDKLKNKAAAVTVDYNFLTSGAKEQPTQKRQVIESRLKKSEVNLKADVIRPYHVGVKDGKFPRFSEDFVEKHVAASVQFAQQKAIQRYQANNAIIVSTFFLSADATEFHKEVELLRNAGLFVAIHDLFEAKSIKYRLKNKQIRSIVISSKRDYTLLNCTQANGFVPQPFQREVYYSFCFVGAKGDFLVNHYIKKSDLFTENDGLLGEETG